MLVLVEVDGRVATVTLNRPEARNALSGELLHDLEAAITGLDEREDVSVMVLTGADPAFCAGVDLKSLSSESRTSQQERQQRPPRFLGMLPPHQTPIIGAVNGPTVTGGLEIALGCDFLIASERARFADTHARVGAMPGGGLTVRLPQLIGIDRARRMSFTGDFIDAETAYAWGLVVEVVPHESLLPGPARSPPPWPRSRTTTCGSSGRMYEEIGAHSGQAAWRAESEWSRRWMAERFDQSRLSTERERIVARGRAQTKGLDGTTP